MEKRDEEDRLSMLPDGVLIHILSFLDTKYAVQTSVLSKRWINIWTSITNLTFNSTLFRRLSSFTKFIDQVLILRNDSIKVNSLNFSCPRSFGRCISLLEDEYRILPFQRVIKYAEAHDVQNLNFFICKYGSYTFSEFLYSCTSLRILSLRITGPLENLEKTLCFKQLKILHLERIWLVESNPIAGCPNLEDLTLIDCSSSSSYRSLIISAPKLSRVAVSSMSAYYTINEIVLLTENLTSFNYHGRFPPLLSPNDLPLLETVTINLDATNRVMNQKRGIDLINTLKVFHNTKSLILSRGTVELLSMVVHKSALEASPISNLKCLSFITTDGHGSYSIPAHVMTYLLKDSPNADVVFKLPRWSIKILWAAMESTQNQCESIIQISADFLIVELL